MTCLDVLDFVMAEGKMPFHTQVGSKDFLNTLLTLLKTRDSPEVIICI